MRGSSVAQKQAVRDFGKSRARALKDIRDKVPVRQRAGLPRFKKRGRARPTVNYTRQGFALKDGNLILAGGVTVRVVWSRPLPSAPSSVRVCRDAPGHWHASFVVATEAEPYPGTGGAVGIDWGVQDIAVTTSDAHDLPHPQYGNKQAQKLSRYQRQTARRKPEPVSRRPPGTSGPGARRPGRTPRRRRSGGTPPASGPGTSSATTT